MNLNNDCHCGECPQCPPGPEGPMGPQGTQGLQGVPGVDGAQGNEGPQGPLGLQGLIGPQGSPGQAGVPGPQGIAGPIGLQGMQGQMGLQGAQGPKGDQGSQGPQGIPGDCVKCESEPEKPEYGEVYSILPQVLDPSPGPNLQGGVALFENLVVGTSNLDFSTTAIDGQIKINRRGWYDVASGMTGALNPIPSPLPVWTLSLFLNGNIVQPSTFSNVPLSPAQASNEITADAFVFCNIGDVLTLANTSTAPVFLTAPSLGTNAQTISAYLKIVLLEAI